MNMGWDRNEGIGIKERWDRSKDQEMGRKRTDKEKKMSELELKERIRDRTEKGRIVGT